MKAILYQQYGPPDVLQMADIAKPIPKPNEILIKTYATTVTSGDWRVRSSDCASRFWLYDPFGVWRVPAQAADFGLGVGRGGGIGGGGGQSIQGGGGGVCVQRCPHGLLPPNINACRRMVRWRCKPPGLSYGEAAALSFGGTTALGFSASGPSFSVGESVLINGASGAVGAAAVQLARYFGAHVTAVCGTANMAWVRALGASQVIDYTQEDFTQNGQTYHVIMDTVGTAPFSRCQASLRDGGRLLLVLAGLADMLHAPWASLTQRQAGDCRAGFGARGRFAPAGRAGGGGGVQSGD